MNLNFAGFKTFLFPEKKTWLKKLSNVTLLSRRVFLFTVLMGHADNSASTKRAMQFEYKTPRSYFRADINFYQAWSGSYFSCPGCRKCIPQRCF